MAAEPSIITSLTDLRTQQQPANAPVVRAGFSDLAGFELAQRAAKALASSSLVPPNYQGNLADCIVALELAQRIGASPLMVMQNLYIVHGRPAWSSQFLIAAVNQCGRYTALQYEWSGKEGTESWTCRAIAKDKATGERVQGPAVSIGMAKKEGWYDKKGSKWQTIPELMLMYRAAGWFARTNAPDLTMGLTSQEEAYDVIETVQTGPGQFAATVDDLKQSPKDAAPADPNAPDMIDFDTALVRIDKAPNSDTAELVLDQARGQPWYGKAVEAFNARWPATA